MLIVEDGTIVPGANSYIDRAAYIAYAALRGVVIADEDAADAEIIGGMDYVETQRFIGERIQTGLPTLYAPIDTALPEQPCQWPRMGIYPFDDNPRALRVIPAKLMAAQAQVALDIHNGFKPFVNIAAGSRVVSEKIGPLSRTYANDQRAVTLMPIAAGLLRGLVLTGALAYRL